MIKDENLRLRSENKDLRATNDRLRSDLNALRNAQSERNLAKQLNTELERLN